MIDIYQSASQCQIIWMNIEYWKTSCSPFPISGWRRLWLLAGQEGEGGRPPILLSPTRLSLKGLQTSSSHLQKLQTSSSHLNDVPTYKFSKPLAPAYKTPPDSSPDLQAAKSSTYKTPPDSRLQTSKPPNLPHTRLSMIGLQTSNLKVQIPKIMAQLHRA